MGYNVLATLSPAGDLCVLLSCCQSMSCSTMTTMTDASMQIVKVVLNMGECLVSALL